MSRVVYPSVLILLAIIPLLIYLRYRSGNPLPALRYSALGYLRTLSPSFWARISWLPYVQRLIALTLLLVALARPQIGAREDEIRAEGIDIMLVVDVSASMLAQDFQPDNRLQVAKQVVADFVLQRTRDRLGMIVFARYAITKTPLTLDHEILLNQLDEVEVGIVPDGTAIGNAVASGVNRLKDSDAKSRVMILLTDGENNAGEIDPVTASQLAKTYGVRVYTVGAGKEGLVPYPFPDGFGRTMLRQVEVPIDEDTLEEIATISEGQFFRAQDAESLSKVYAEIDELERSEIEQIQYVSYVELASYLMVAALGLLLTESVLSRTKLQSLP